MKQILQNPRTGALELAEVPAPAVGRGQLLVRNAFSVLSPGTEKLALDFARKSLLGKARSRPDLVRQVTRKLRNEGPLATYRAVTSRLEAPQPLGYSSSGVIEAVGEGVTKFRRGDRVACAGAGYACHAEIIVVPENLVALVPNGLPLQQAAFATLGAIALQGLRVAAPTLGEVAAVIGLGPIGQLAVQLLRANGCRVLAIDLDAARLKHALDQGAEWGAAPQDDLNPWKRQATAGYGADLAIVTASSNNASPLRLAAELCRLKGRISLVGAFPIEIDRRLLYDKELELRMSTSYGPGRYDRSYEEDGVDYPLPWVRWTETRNLQAFLALAARKDVQPDKLHFEEVAFTEAVRIYSELADGERRAVAALFRYDPKPASHRSILLTAHPPKSRPRPRQRRNRAAFAFLGAGTYARSTLLPLLARRDDADPVALVTSSGASARATATRFGFARCGTDCQPVLSDPEIDLVFIVTRHDSHADLAEQALRAGKSVWLEKPVGLTPAEVAHVLSAAEQTHGFLFIGYNRRFSTHMRALRRVFGNISPLAIHYRIAPGPPPRNSWITDPNIGGGRIVGEICHFIDLSIFLIGQSPRSVTAHALSMDPASDDSVIALFSFPNGSTATISYLSSADSRLPKEHVEISGNGITATSEDFRLTRFCSGHSPVRTRGQDKGHASALNAVISSVRAGSPSPILLPEIRASSLAPFAIAESIRTGRSVLLSA